MSRADDLVIDPDSLGSPSVVFGALDVTAHTAVVSRAD
jgi:hypothetical protein